MQHIVIPALHVCLLCVLPAGPVDLSDPQVRSSLNPAFDEAAADYDAPARHTVAASSNDASEVQHTGKPVAAWLGHRTQVKLLSIHV